MVTFPQRQEFIWLDFDPQIGHEQKGRRPGLVVSHTLFNQKMGFVYICPLSSTSRSNPFYVTIPEGLMVNGVIMCDQLRSLDFRARKFEFICDCPNLLFQDVLRRIKPILF
ncbi:MAG: type II toxin-antitoxin system PemK/MazF family toxin [Waterburya sp.]